MTKVANVIEFRKNNFRVYFSCDYCSTQSSQSKAVFNRKKRHFCNTECYTLFRVEKLPKTEQHRYGTGFPKQEREKRRKARSDLNHAIRDGKVIRALFCETQSCLELPEAHHDDYDKPLDVRWLCFKHHRKHHKEIHENKELLND